MVIRWITYSAIFLLSGCSFSDSTHVEDIDEVEVEHLVENTIKLDEPIKAREIFGGHSGNRLFLASYGKNQYVVRFFKSLSEARKEIICQRIASNSGYGPHLFYSNTDKGYLIMEYIKKDDDKNQITSLERYSALGTALYKMHNGEPFPDEGMHIFERINRDILLLKERKSFESVANQLAKMMKNVEKNNASSLQMKAPCHNDLHPGNMIYSNGVYKIVDFGDAIQDDPYFDIATVIVFNCFSSEQEDVILKEYFGRQITSDEKSKLITMKQAVYICWAARGFLENDKTYDPEKEDKLSNEIFAETLEKFWIGSDLDKKDIHLLSGYIFYREAVRHFQSGQ